MISSFIHSFIHRIGSTLTIVEFMVSTIFRPLMEHNCQLTIPELILLIHHAFPIDQVCFVVLSYVIILCSDNRTAWQYGLTGSPKSSVTILAGSLASNQTYQFMVYMVNQQNSNIQGTGILLVQVQDKISPMIAIR